MVLKNMCKNKYNTVHGQCMLNVMFGKSSGFHVDCVYYNCVKCKW